MDSSLFALLQKSSTDTVQSCSYNLRYRVAQRKDIIGRRAAGWAAGGGVRPSSRSVLTLD